MEGWRKGFVEDSGTRFAWLRDFRTSGFKTRGWVLEVKGESEVRGWCCGTNALLFFFFF